MPIVADTKLYERVKAMADQKYAKPSAYKSGYIVKTYKQMGGEYIDDGKPKNLKRWYKERWSDVGGLDYPVLRPTVKVSKKTPLLPSEISNLKDQIQLKQKIKGKKNLPPFISKVISMKGKKGRMYGGMDRLPQEMLHGISGYLRPPRVHEVQQQFPGYAQGNFALEHGVRERQRIRDRNVRNLGVMNANRQERMEAAIEFVQSPVQEQIAEIEGGLPILQVRQMYRMTNANLPYQLLIRYPAVGSGRKGGMPRKDKDIILPPPAVARAVTGEPTRPFEGQEVYADFPEAQSVFSDATLAEEQREIARAEQRDQANIDSLFRQYGQMYPGGLSAQGSATDYSDFTNRYLPSRRMNESYVANLPEAQRGRIIAAFLRQRQGMCVASGKPKRVSKWIEHVKAHAKKHGVSYKQAMQDSRRTYVG
jgi:hypothetical protein